MDPGLNSAFEAGFSSAAHASLKLSPPASASSYWGHDIPIMPVAVSFFRQVSHDCGIPIWYFLAVST